MNYRNLTLIIPDKPDPERDSVANAWENSGGTVLRLGRFWDPPELISADVRVYGNDTFCLVLAQKLCLDLISPEITAEVRCFILENRILDCAIYEGDQAIESAVEFAALAAKELSLPSTCVLARINHKNLLRRRNSRHTQCFSCSPTLQYVHTAASGSLRKSMDLTQSSTARDEVCDLS